MATTSDATAAVAKQQHRSSSKKSKDAVTTGGCGCKLKGGSLASDHVIKAVSEAAWAELNRNATNYFAPAQKAAQSGGDINANKVGQLLTNLISKTKLHGGGPTLDQLVRNNITGDAKRRYLSVVRKYSAAKKASADMTGGADEHFVALDMINGNIVNHIKKLVGGADASSASDEDPAAAAAAPVDAVAVVNGMLDALTPAGAAKISEFVNDKSMFKGGVSIASAVASLAKNVASPKATEATSEMLRQHGGTVFDLAMRVNSGLSKANLEKVALITGHSGRNAVQDMLQSLSAALNSAASQQSDAVAASATSAASKKKASRRAPLQGGASTR